MTVITRFAPSPTGNPALHIGGGRQALFSFLLARQNGGKFYLRIEDTDQKRYVSGAVEDILTGLEYLGILPDSGPNYQELISLDVDPEIAKRFATKFSSFNNQVPSGFVQSKNTDDRYKKAAFQLVEKNKAYLVFNTDSTEVEDSVNIKKLKKDKDLKDTNKVLNLEKWRNAPPLLVERALATGRPYTIRIKIPHDFSTVVCNDTIRGEIFVNTASLFDAVLLKSDGNPTYHLASVVDDHYQAITDVIRNEEWLSTFPIHTLLYQYLEWEMPRFTHTASILNPNGKGKISKRSPQMEGIPVFVNEYRKDFLPESLLNMLALTGWNPGEDREFMLLDDMLELFSLNRINPTGSAWNYTKLLKMNQKHLEKLPNERWLKEIKKFI